MSTKIVSGEYEGKEISLASGTPYIIMGWNPKKNIALDSTTVARYELVAQGEKKRAGRAVVGTILAGPIGLAVGALSAKTKGMLVVIEFKDGSKSLIECDKKVYDAIVKKCFDLERKNNE